jgi:hypothetical protein
MFFLKIKEFLENQEIDYFYKDFFLRSWITRLIGSHSLNALLSSTPVVFNQKKTTSTIQYTHASDMLSVVCAARVLAQTLPNQTLAPLTAVYCNRCHSWGNCLL